MSQAHVELDALAEYETYVGKVLPPSAWANLLFHDMGIP